MPAQHTSSHLANLQRDGFVVVKSIVPPEKLEALRSASRRAEQLARSGRWPHVRTVGKQFPPWDHREALEKGIWGVQHLMNPQMPGHETFTELYFAAEILGVVKELLRCEDEELVMELLNMLVRPESDFELRWHRDDIPAEASPDEETERLGRPALHTQYNIALWEDESLILVPGSHRRARTEAERNAAPFERELPGQLVVRLEPGDVAFYDNNILHRGAYDSKRQRATLHGSVGHVGGSKARARNVLQHGVGGWIDGVDLSAMRDEAERERAEGMRERLVKLASESGDVGYSLRG
ncbi:phytanoyl- dioxygenase [Trichoderma cornu-damae]|uniref:Phytanoyl- dioxygenase n=1 Tax=Trichoderma cornu-damae TaxID=654480 RepID=A0A9P8QNQ2_9HYPO|nr:phytanoyl- dioxygenase [Trichoderma cornu-damae]